MAVNYHGIGFLTLAPGIHAIKLFWHKFTLDFCKQDHFINVTIIFLCCKKVQISKRVSKFMRKKVVRDQLQVSMQ